MAALRARAVGVLMAVTLFATGVQTAYADALGALFGGPFELTRHDGETVRDIDFHGRHMLIYFGYTTCPVICPTDLAIMADALDMAGDAADKVQPVFVTVDPMRDTADVLAGYVADFHPRLIGLTGDDAAIERALKAYQIGRQFLPDPDGDPDAYLINHTPTTFLMGPDGAFETLLPYGTPAEKIAEIIRGYVDGADGSD